MILIILNKPESAVHYSWNLNQQLLQLIPSLLPISAPQLATTSNTITKNKDLTDPSDQEVRAVETTAVVTQKEFM